jgi:hypothetical protein
VDVLNQIKNEEIVDTYFYDHEWKVDELSSQPKRDQGAENIQRFQLYSSILTWIGKGYVEGDKTTGNTNPHYKNLKLTTSGKKYVELMSRPINDILQPTWLETITKAVTGRLIAVIVVPIILFIVDFFFPNLKSYLWELLISCLNFISAKAGVSKT